MSLGNFIHKSGESLYLTKMAMDESNYKIANSDNIMNISFQISFVYLFFLCTRYLRNCHDRKFHNSRGIFLNDFRKTIVGIFLRNSVYLQSDQALPESKQISQKILLLQS